MREAGEKKYDKERSSSRQSIPEVSVELRRRADSETPDWVELAVNISRKGMLLHLPEGMRLGDLVFVRFTLSEPRASFRRLEAIVIRRYPGGLGVLGFAVWPPERKSELAAWLQERAA